jgi:hypothetical protein
MKEGYGLTEERRAPFYMPAYTQLNQLTKALSLIKITSSPTSQLHADITDALTLLFGRPQRDLLREFEVRVAHKYVGKLATTPNKNALRADARAFLRTVASTYMPK